MYFPLFYFYFYFFFLLYFWNYPAIHCQEQPCINKNVLEKATIIKDDYDDDCAATDKHNSKTILTFCFINIHDKISWVAKKKIAPPKKKQKTKQKKTKTKQNKGKKNKTKKNKKQKQA